MPGDDDDGDGVPRDEIGATQRVVEGINAGQAATEATGEHEPDQILESCARLYRKKDREYGSAWKLTGQTISLWCQEMGVDSIELSTDPETFISLFLYMHRLEKIIRAFNGEFVLEGEMNFESIADSHRDEAPYAGMHASLLETVRDVDG